jgi:hypothetical protein
MEPLAILAHEGGWDELLMVGAPILVFGGMLFVARRRAVEQATKSDEKDPG